MLMDTNAWEQHCTADVMRCFHDELAAEADVDSIDYLFASAPFDPKVCAARIFCARNQNAPVFQQCDAPCVGEYSRFCESHAMKGHAGTLLYEEWDPASDRLFCDKTKWKDCQARLIGNAPGVPFGEPHRPAHTTGNAQAFALAHRQTKAHTLVPLDVASCQ